MYKLQVRRGTNIISFECESQGYILKQINDIEYIGAVIDFNITLPLRKALQLKKIMESGHKVKNWCITHISFNPSGLVEIQAYKTKEDTTSFEYKNFLKFNTK